jgi:SAM-dependent methyltransferase
MNAGAEWSQGYVTDVSYTNSFFRELSPVWLNHVAIVGGTHPRALDGGFTHIDLGCGLGQSVNVLAGCFPRGQFYGVDFNPAHIHVATHNAALLGLDNARFVERSFQDLLTADLPDFDFITLHGIYSWIGEDARKAVQRFIFEKLKPGGIVYNSYNCLPGWSAEAPIRRLLLEFAGNHSGDSAARAEQAAKDAAELANLKLGYFRANAGAADAVSKLPKRQSNYLAHEYLNAAWNTFYSADVADEMAAAKLTYLGSATLIENQLDLILPDAAAAYCRKQPSERMRQLAQDFLTGQRFRRDVFVRGHPRLTRGEISRYLRNSAFALPGPIEDFGDKTKVPRGEISFDAKSAAAVREMLAEGSATLEQIIAEVGPKAKGAADVERTVLMMTAVGKLVPVGSAFTSPLGRSKPDRLRLADPVNRAVVRAGRQSLGRQYLMSRPVGTGLSIDSLDVLALALLEEGVPVSNLATAAGAELHGRGIKVNKDGVPLEDAAAAAAHVSEIVGKFVSHGLPLLGRFGIIEAA